MLRFLLCCWVVSTTSTATSNHRKEWMSTRLETAVNNNNIHIRISNGIVSQTEIRKARPFQPKAICSEANGLKHDEPKTKPVFNSRDWAHPDRKPLTTRLYYKLDDRSSSTKHVSVLNSSHRKAYSRKGTLNKNVGKPVTNISSSINIPMGYTFISNHTLGKASRRDSPLSDRTLDKASRRDSPLSDRTLDKDSRRDSPLSDHTLNKASRRDSPLSNRTLDKASRRDSPLSDRTLDKASSRDSPLSDHTLDNASNRDSPLSDHALNKASSRDSPLSDHTLDNASSRDSPLSDRTLDKASSRDSSLSDHTLNKASSRDSPLSDHTLDKASSRDSPLSDHTLDNASSRDSPLSDRTLDKASSRDSSLSDHTLNKASSRDSPLSDHTLDNASSHDSSLSDHTLDKASSRDIPLSDRTLDKASRRDSLLSDHTLDKASRRDSPLSDHTLNKTSSRDSSLSDNTLDRTLGSIIKQRHQFQKTSTRRRRHITSAVITSPTKIATNKYSQYTMTNSVGGVIDRLASHATKKCNPYMISNGGSRVNMSESIKTAPLEPSNTESSEHSLVNKTETWTIASLEQKNAETNHHYPVSKTENRTLPSVKLNITKRSSNHSVDSTDTVDNRWSNPSAKPHESQARKPDSGATGQSVTTSFLHLDTNTLTRCFIRTGFRPLAYTYRKRRKLDLYHDKVHLDRPEDNVAFHVRIEETGTLTVDFKPVQPDTRQRLNYTLNYRPGQIVLEFLYDCVIKVELHTQSQVVQHLQSKLEDPLKKEFHIHKQTQAQDHPHNPTQSPAVDQPRSVTQTSAENHRAHNPTLNTLKNQTQNHTGNHTQNKAQNQTLDTSKNQTQNNTGKHTQNKAQNQTLDTSKNQTQNHTGQHTQNKAQNQTIDTSMNQTQNHTGKHTQNKAQNRTLDKSINQTQNHTEKPTQIKAKKQAILVVADFSNRTSHNDMAIMAYDPLDSNEDPFILNRISTDPEADTWGTVVAMRGRQVYLHICLYNIETLTMKVRFLVIPKSSLQVDFHSSQTSGFVQTPMYDGSRTYANDLHYPWAHVTVPLGHVIMLSFPAGKMMGCLILEWDSSWSSQCCQEYPKASVYSTTYMAVGYSHECSGWWSKRDYTGLRLDFSFHEDSVAPVQLTDGSWDCSVPHWPEFRHHLQCNLLAECQDKRDEVDCPYYSARCGPGYLTAGDKCLFFLAKLGEELHWYEAQARCQERGERLVTLKMNADALQLIGILQRILSGTIYPIYIGYYEITSTNIYWYRDAYRWLDGTVFHVGDNIAAEKTTVSLYTVFYCACLSVSITKRSFDLFSCDSPAIAGALCEKRVDEAEFRPPAPVVLPAVSDTPFTIQTVKCDAGYLTHDFLACDATTSCWSRDKGVTCTTPQMTCRNGIGRVSYTLVCDHRSDCDDDSDEEFCDFPACGKDSKSCGDAQCVSRANVCNGFMDCLTQLDELNCFRNSHGRRHKQTLSYSNYIINVIRLGQFHFQEITKTDDVGSVVCPVTHFLCSGVCLPFFFRCNGEKDCLHHEDEADCEAWTCPGFYRCRDSRTCLQPEHVCDGIPHCPMGDDELMCNATCPDNCLCQGHAFSCDGSFSVKSFPQLRYLDVSQTNLTSAEVTGTPLLVFLNLSQCGLTRLHDLTLPNLLYLDVSHNLLTSLNASHFSGVPQVREVSLSANPFLRLVDSGQASHTSLTSLDLSGVPLPRLNASVLAAFPSLQRLNLSGSGVQRVVDEGFQQLTQLRQVDLRGCPVSHVPAVMFQSVERLQKVYADSFRLCCPALLPPGFNVHECEAPVDEVSSCDDLLGSDIYSALNFVLAALTLVGNSTSFVFRTFVSKSKSKLGFRVFVTHLCISDFLMGVYLLILGIADRVYTGRYLWNDLVWRHSAACKVAGFLSLLSSEVSVLVMCLITVDRFLVLRFPFSLMHFGVKSARITSFMVWAVGLILVSIPLLSMTSHWEFYSQSSICIPLPITRKDFAGRGFSFSIFIILNFVLFLIICSGQLVIYCTVRASSMSVGNTNRKNKDLSIARRLVTVAMSDFLCWFPIGVLGLLASRGVPIPGEVNVAVAVLVLPINSALNPFLYTLNVLMERRRLAREKQLRKFITSQLTGSSGD